MTQLSSATATPLPVEPVRDASRRLVRELGFLAGGLAGTDLPPSSVHALLEIEARDALAAGDLCDALRLDKSSVSRLLRKLVEAGEIAQAPNEDDGRIKHLSLTERGRTTVAGLHAFARRQVSGALARLDEADRRTVADGLRLYADALATGRRAPGASPAVTIEAGYRPGALGRCAELHARSYSALAGFGRPFEALVAAGLAEFAGRLERPANGVWLALCEGTVVGTVAIDGEDLGEGLGHLRWFVLDEAMRGLGAGRRLLDAALAFCDRQGFCETHLWTFRGLDAARHLYEAAGFALAEERTGRQWGAEVLEQRFVRPRPAAA